MSTFFPQLKTVSYEKSDEFAEKNTQKNMTSSNASKSAVPQKHDVFLTKQSRATVACHVDFPGEKNSMRYFAGNLDLYIHVFWFTIFRKIIRCFVSSGAMISLQIGGFCWPLTPEKRLWIIRKGCKGAPFFTRHDRRCSHKMSLFKWCRSGLYRQHLRVSITKQIFKNRYASCSIFT